MAHYDFLVVGCGLYGIVFARQMTDANKKVLIIEKRNHIGGNCYTEEYQNINIHKYGPHIFHTDNKTVWDYVNHFAQFNNFINRPKVFYKDKLYSFPINLMTLYQLWNVLTPAQAEKKLKATLVPNDNPENMEDWAISQVGRQIYEIFIKGYTKKQWGKNPNELPSNIIKRLPIRLTFDDNYYSHRYQGIPIGGYTIMFGKMLDGIEIKLETDYFDNKSYWDSVASNVVYTGKLDEYFNYKYGELEYRGLRFENKILKGDFQGNAVINYTDEALAYTRVIEHKHFEFIQNKNTVVTWEYPDKYDKNKIPYHPVNTDTNNKLYERYEQEAVKEKNLILGGRLAQYKYLDMDQVMLAALETSRKFI